MKLVLEVDGTDIRLTALTMRRMRRLAELSVGIIEAGASKESAKPEFGFAAGSSVHAEIAEEWRWPAQVATKPRLGPRP